VILISYVIWEHYNLSLFLWLPMKLPDTILRVEEM